MLEQGLAAWHWLSGLPVNPKAPSPRHGRSVLYSVEGAGRAAQGTRPAQSLGPDPTPMSRPVRRILDDNDLADLILLVVCAFTVVGVGYLVARILGH